ncbi:MAG TPA: Uma2 family endonuclease, partial [Urbifossiella sp.]
IGYYTGADDLIEVLPKLVRGPDVSFTSWLRRPEMTVDFNFISRVIPDLTVEVLSRKNTRGEIARKLKEYFLVGVRLVWIIDLRQRTAVFTRLLKRNQPSTKPDRSTAATSCRDSVCRWPNYSRGWRSRNRRKVRNKQ